MATPPTARFEVVPYRGPDDFATMARVITESCRASGPLAGVTVGDIEWWTVNDPDQALEGNAEVWLLDGEPVGWAWPDPPSSGEWHLRPGVPRAPFLAPLLDRLEAALTAAAGAGAAGQVISLAGKLVQAVPTATTTWAMDTDVDAIDLLTGRGYEADGMALSHWYRRLPRAGGAPIPDVALPAGYRHASVRWPDDIAARVEVHRSAFAPSRMTVEKYRRLEALPHYAPERDRVVVAPDGSFAAFADAWYDPVARIGELEPVGTHADHRRLGLGRAVCFEALRALDAAGAEACTIFSHQANTASEALYASLGCERVTTSRRYARALPGSRPSPG